MDVSVIILNYNTSRYTIDCIQSIKEKESKNLNYEIIVVDNASEKVELEILEQELTEDIIFIKSRINLGFGGGHMLGFQKAKGKYLAFLNNDIYFKDSCLKSLFDFMENNPDVGVSTPQQWNAKDKRTTCFDHYHGIRHFLFGNWALESIFNYPKRKAIYHKPLVVDFIQGCFMFFRTSAFTKIGGFDTNIFLYYEEMDICKRLKNINFKSIFYPDSHFVHYHEVSTNKHFSLQKKKEIILSYLYILRKNFGFSRFFIIKNLMMVSYIFKSLVSPKKIPILKMLLFFGSPLSHSLKHKVKSR